MMKEKKIKNIGFSKKALEKLTEILSRYPDRQAALLPALHLAQKEFGYVDNEIVAYIAELLNLAASEVEGAKSFYTLFSTPEMGKYVIRVCQTLSCSLLGADHLLDYLSKKLGIKPGQTTQNKKFTLLKCECLGSCGTAPVMTINDKYYENLTQQKIDKILKNLK
jgi:NADH-quinone oxidoreductase subunit E